jgi:ubiquinone/menaquinone biosynthesis C-methylase UbiE
LEKKEFRRINMENNNGIEYDGYYKYDAHVASNYNLDRQNEEHWIKENNFVLQYFKKNRVEHLLDLPVGTGRFFEFYENINKITGIDISDAMLTEAEKKLQSLAYAEKIRLEKGDVFNLKYRDASFDTIIVFRLFHLIPEDKLDDAIKELCRVGKRDVIVQSYELLKLSFLERVKNKLKRAFKKILNLKTSKGTKNETKEKPWSHISAYFYKEGLISSYFFKNGYSISQREILCSYETAKVIVTIFTKN